MILNFLLAQQEKYEPLGIIGEEGGFGPWAQKILDNAQPEILLADIISNILGAMTIGAGIWFLFQAIIAGYNYLSAGGDKTKIEASGRRLTNSLIGIAIVVAAYGLIALLGTFLGVDFLNIADLIGIITPTK